MRNTLKTAEDSKASQMSRVSLLRNACPLGIAWGWSKDSGPGPICVLGNYEFPLIFQGAGIFIRVGRMNTGERQNHVRGTPRVGNEKLRLPAAAAL